VVLIDIGCYRKKDAVLTNFNKVFL
jgi:hypothetical protein